MRDFAQIAAGISRGAADRLAAEGFAVVDGLLGGDWATALLREMESLVDGGLMREHKFQFAQAQLRKPHIYEADMHDAALRDDPRRRTPEIDAFFQRQPLAEALNQRLPQLQLAPEATRARSSSSTTRAAAAASRATTTTRASPAGGRSHASSTSTRTGSQETAASWSCCPS